jgi:ABC-2 type transport system permease protein
LLVLLNSFRQRAVYRINVYTGIISSLLGLLVTVSLWSALFAGGRVVAGVGLPEMITYVVVMQLLGALTSTNIGEILAGRIEQGTIAIDLARPLKLRRALVAEAMGGSLFDLLFTALPPVIAVSLIFGLRLPAHPMTLLLFAVSAALGVALSYYLGYLLGLTAFWFKTSFHVDWFYSAFMILFGGSFLPLWFYPPTLSAVSRYLPFRMIAFDPTNIFLERIVGAEALRIIGTQAVWVVVLLAACELAWIPAQRVVTVHGG